MNIFPAMILKSTALLAILTSSLPALPVFIGTKWLLCAHRDSNTISALPLNPATGELGPPANTVSCPSPICILFGR